jgi:hypothetical protein
MGILGAVFSGFFPRKILGKFQKLQNIKNKKEHNIKIYIQSYFDIKNNISPDRRTIFFL